MNDNETQPPEESPPPTEEGAAPDDSDAPAETTEPTKSEAGGPRKAPRAPYGLGVPALGLAECVRTVEHLARTSGDEGPMDAVARALGNSLASSTFDRRLTALRRFGLLTTTSKTYSVTALAQRIVYPQSSEGRAAAIFEAFSQNDILRRIWERYRTRILPQPEYLPHNLTTLDIPRDLSEGWAAYFREAAQFAGLLYEKEPGTFTVQSTPMFGDVPQDAPEEHAPPPDATQTNADTTRHREDVPTAPLEQQAQEPAKLTFDQFVRRNYDGIVRQKRVSRGRVAYFLYPEEMTKSDVTALQRIIAAELEILEAYMEDGEEREEPT